MNKKEEMFKKISDFLDGIFKADPVETNTESTNNLSTETELAKPEETPVEDVPSEETPNTLKIGDVLPDGEYEIMDQIVTLKDGKIEAITPKVMESQETKMSVEEVKLNLQKELDEKLKLQKEAFDKELDKLSKTVIASGIIQAPIEEKIEPRELTAKEIIMRNAENKRNNK